MTPLDAFIKYVPKVAAENLQWRIKMRRLALFDKGLQRALRQAAFEDVLFFFNAFLWLKEPRASIKEIPFTTWPHQDLAFRQMDDAVAAGERTGETIDVLVPKSREQGGTFGACGVIARRWLRDRGFSAGIVTRNEQDVDSKTNASAVMYKIVYMLNMLPWWMRPEGWNEREHRSLTDHVIYNPVQDSTITGSAAVADLFRGGRLTVLFFDEAGSTEWMAAAKDWAAAASTAHVANCRIFVSTFGADSGMFYEACQEASKGDSSAKLLKLDWRENPVHSRLAFSMRDGYAFARDPADQPAVAEYVKSNRRVADSLSRKGFIKDGRLVSPWYIGHCLRPGATPRSIAREIDMDARGAVGKVFDTDVLDAVAKECQPPMWQGKLLYDAETFQPKGLLRQENGPLKLWFIPGLDNTPPSGRYALGCDIGTGRGTDESSNSAVFGANLATKEQVLAYANRSITPIKFARLAVAIAHWLFDAYLNWDGGGPYGGAFREEVVEVIGYRKVFLRPIDPAVLFLGPPGEKAGSYFGNDEMKANLFETMSMEMADDGLIPRDEDFVKECGEYEWEGSKIVHRPSRTKKEDGRAHGDRAIAGGCCLVGMKDLAVGGIDRETEVAHNPPYGSWAWRQKREEDEARDRDEDAPQFTLFDLLHEDLLG